MRTLIQTFANFVPRRLVQQLVLTGTPMTLGGSRRELTILFTDVVNFTGITESAEPTQVMLYTSRYFSAVSEAVMASKGTIDKFIGDGVMAFWNAPAEDPDHALNACAGALAFLRVNDRLNAEFEREGWPAYRTRIGLHTGEAVVGNIGSEDRMNYTALGATVNLAARLEGLNKNYGTSILVSAALRERASSRFVFRRVDRISPKGFAEAFDIYELRCERGEGDARNRELSLEWEVVYAALRNGPRAVAESELSAFMRKYPEDEIARYYQAAARHSPDELGGHAAVARGSGPRPALSDLRVKSNLASRIKLFLSVQSLSKKYSAFRVSRKSPVLSPAIPFRERGVGHRHERWGGLRWTRAALLTNSA